MPQVLSLHPSGTNTTTNPSYRPHNSELAVRSKPRMLPLLPLLLLALWTSPVSAGYTIQSLGTLVYCMKEIFSDTYPNLRMIEFGNQETHDKVGADYPIYEAEGFFTLTNPTKYFFQHMGIDYDSIDLNGFDGSLKLDCRQDISAELEPADVLTNIGFSEHVGEGDSKDNVIRNQYTFFKNMHDLAKVGALLFHVFMTQFPGHGVAQYTPEFTVEFPKKSNYVLVFEPFQNPHQIQDKGVDILSYIAAYRKVVDEPFMSFADFESIPGLRNIAYQSDLVRNVGVQIFRHYTKSKEIEFVFQIDQELSLDKSFSEWADFFCRVYFTNTPESENRFLINDLNQEFCKRLTLIHIEKSSIEHAIRS